MLIRGFKLWLGMEILRNLTILVTIRIPLKDSDSVTVPLMINDSFDFEEEIFGEKKKAGIFSGINVEKQIPKMLVIFHEFPYFFIKYN